MDAIDGFDIDYIENQKYPMDPFNSTFIIILNYQIIILILISGNYIIKIFSEGESNKPIANIKFLSVSKALMLILILMNQVMLNRVNIFNHMKLSTLIIKYDRPFF